MSALEQSLIDLCEQHNLTVISVGMNLKQIDAYRFDATVHWDGFTRTSHAGCAGESAATIADALAKTISRSIADRTPFVEATLADEALPAV